MYFQENTAEFLALQPPWVQQLFPAVQTAREAYTPDLACLVRSMVAASAAPSAIATAVTTVWREQHTKNELLFEMMATYRRKAGQQTKLTDLFPQQAAASSMQASQPATLCSRSAGTTRPLCCCSCHFAFPVIVFCHA
jgi:hypothetical protein